MFAKEKPKKPITDQEAINSMEFTGTYLNVAISQFRLSRKKGCSIEQSLSDANNKVAEIATSVINRKG